MNPVRILLIALILTTNLSISLGQFSTTQRIIKKVKKKKADNLHYENSLKKLNEVQKEIDSYNYQIYNSQQDKFQDKKLKMLLGAGCKFFSKTVNHCLDKKQKYCDNVSLTYYLNPFYIHHEEVEKELFGFFIQARRNYTELYNTELRVHSGKQAEFIQLASSNENIIALNKIKGGHSMNNLNDRHFNKYHCEDFLYDRLEILREAEMEDRRYPYSYLRGTYFVSKEEFLNLLSGKIKHFRFSGNTTSEDIDVNISDFNTNLISFKNELIKLIN
jgi:hypothetical protein